MNNTTNSPGAVASVLCTLLLGLILSNSVLADNYRVKIRKITQETTGGDIIIHIKPGTNEKDFTGKARVRLPDNTVQETNRALATLLTAVSLNTDILIDVVNPPSFDNAQVIDSLTLIAP